MINFKNIPDSDKPRERLFNYGSSSLSDEELAEKVALISSKLGENIASMDELIAFRKKARDEKNWDVADKIRFACDEVGIILKDSKEGTVWELKNS